MTAPVCSAHPQPEGWHFRPLSSPHSGCWIWHPSGRIHEGRGRCRSPSWESYCGGPARGALPAPNPLPPPLAPRAGPLWPQIFPQAKLILTGLYESLPTFSPTVGVGKAGAIFQDPSHCYF